jgi:long-chain fatty acid transport protein
MRRRGGSIWRALVVAALGTLATLPLHAAGFAIYEAGSKALGMADAFTAQADDPSALFFNAGGAAFFDHTAVSVGVTYITESGSTFSGANPFPGEGATGHGKKLNAFPPHAYWIQPITSTVKFGVGLTAPFGLTTAWRDPHNFPGRFISTKADLKDLDVNPTLAWQVTPNFGIGIGAVARVSKVELDRDAPAVNPFTFTVADVATSKLTSSWKAGYGANIGVLHHFNSFFSWGLSYRTPITVNYKGNDVLTQNLTGNAQLDAVVAARLPFNKKLPVKTAIKFPDQASLGLAFSLTPNVLLETDVNWTGWSHFKQVNVEFTQGDLPNQTVVQRWKDVFHFRGGLRWTTSPVWQWRFGYVHDLSPQPEQTMSPLLPDADRNGFTFGVGYTAKVKTDFAVMYLPFNKRSRAKTFSDDTAGDFFGRYDTKAWLAGVTLGF